MQVKKAIIPVAGMGTRMLPASKVVPKELMPLIDKPALQYIIEELINSGIEDIILVNSPLKKSIKEHFDPHTPVDHYLKHHQKEHLVEDLNVLCQRFTLKEVIQEKAQGLGHAVYCAKRVVGRNPFVVVLPDDIIISKVPATKQHIEIYSSTGNPVIALLRIPRNQIHLYGIAEGYPFFRGNLQDRVLNIKKLVEKPVSSNSNAAVIGRYVLTSNIFNALENTPPGKDGEVQITDALIRFYKKNTLLGLFFEGTRYDVGTKEGFLKAILAFGFRHTDFRVELAHFCKTLLNEFEV